MSCRAQERSSRGRDWEAPPGQPPGSWNSVHPMAAVHGPGWQGLQARRSLGQLLGHPPSSRVGLSRVSEARPPVLRAQTTRSLKDHSSSLYPRFLCFLLKLSQEKQTKSVTLLEALRTLFSMLMFGDYRLSLSAAAVTCCAPSMSWQV